MGTLSAVDGGPEGGQGPRAAAVPPAWPAAGTDPAAGASSARGPSGRLAGRRIGVYGSGGAPWHHLAFAAVHGAQARVVRAEDILAGRLEEIDVLVFPGGGAAAMAGLMAPLGETGALAVRDWVSRGGTYLGSCAGSILPIALSGAADDMIPAARCLRMVQVPMANLGDATLGGVSSPGVGRILVRLDADHPFAAGVPGPVEIVHYNGPLFDMAKASPEVRAFAWPVSTTSGFTPAERFMESPDSPFTGATTVESCIARGAANAVVAPFGGGRVILFGSHPEFGLGPLCLGWGDGALLLLAAMAQPGARLPSEGGVDFAGAEEHAAAREDAGRVGPDGPGREAVAGVAAESMWSVRPEMAGVSAQELAATAVAQLGRAAERFASLAERDAQEWLEPGYAAAFHGRAAREAWPLELQAAAEASASAAHCLAAVAGGIATADAPWLDDRPREGQDFGACGLVQQLALLHAQLDRAEELLDRPAKRPAHAYDLFDAHPFHLAMGSYLSAAGIAAAALLTVAVIAVGKGALPPEAARLLWA